MPLPQIEPFAPLRRALQLLGLRPTPRQERAPLRLQGAGARALLGSAIRQHLPVEFHYRPVTSPGRTGRRVGVPYAIFAKDGRRYLHLYTEPGSVSQRGGLAAWRTFRLDRISNVKLPRGDRAAQVILGGRTAPGFNRSWYRSAVTGIVVRPLQPIGRN